MPLSDRDAVKAAKAYVSRLYEGDELVTNVDLEEIDYDVENHSWKVTIGFSRPFQAPRTRASEVLARIGEGRQLRRSFKVVTVEEDGRIISMRDRSLDHG